MSPSLILKKAKKKHRQLVSILIIVVLLLIMNRRYRLARRLQHQGRDLAKMLLGV